MKDIQKFHQLALALLKNIGLNIDALAADQEVISLDVDNSFSVHIGLLEQGQYFFLAELPQTTLNHLSREQLVELLRVNHINGDQWQPTISLTLDDRIACWLRLPLDTSDLPVLTSALDSVVENAETLLRRFTSAEVLQTTSTSMEQPFLGLRG